VRELNTVDCKRDFLTVSQSTLNFNQKVNFKAIGILVYWYIGILVYLYIGIPLCDITTSNTHYC